jgi:hypothetical protein
MLGKNAQEKEKTPKNMGLCPQLDHLGWSTWTYICGPMPVVFKTWSKYILTFVDNFSRKTLLFLLYRNLKLLRCLNSSKLQLKPLVE